MKNKFQRITVTLLLVIVICLIALVTLLFKLSNTIENSINSKEDYSVNNSLVESEGNISKLTEYVNDNVEMIEIETPYGILNYPAELADYLIYEDEEVNGVYTLKFFANINDQKCDLFQVHFGAESMGTLIGYLNQNETKVSFTVTAGEFSFDESWTNDEQILYNSMAEAVNDVINSVVSNSNYSVE